VKHVTETFGGWVAWRRRTLDLTQADLARRVGCSAISVRKIEADVRTPSRQVAELIIAALQAPPAERAALLALARRCEAAPAPDSAPAPRRASPPAQLPAPLTRLIGRDDDADAIMRLLEGGARLLTLTGPPGIGKTRLALHVASAACERYADGAVFVPLAAIADHSLVLGALAEALAVAEGGRPLADRLAEHLRGRELLLVLDNFEQVLDAAADVAELLARCPHVSVLATSQAALHLRGERRYPVAPLAVPRPGLPAIAAAGFPAVALFVERAQEVEPDFALDEEGAAAVSDICARLDGLPLAIELVAAHCALLSPHALLARLGQRLALLADGPRDLPPRHRALRSAIGWSYNLLEPDDRLAFARLSVFADSFTLEAAAAVGGEEAEAALARLVRRSLVQAEPQPGGARRFRLLETLREYAAEQLGEGDSVRARHAAHFAALAGALPLAPNALAEERAIAALRPEEHNLRAALEWCVDGDPALGLQCATALRRYWLARGLLREGRSWLERLLARAGETPQRAAALAAQGFLAFQQGDGAEAEALCAASLELHGRAGDALGAADALLTLGRVALQQARFCEAERRLSEALALWQRAGCEGGTADALRALSLVAKDRGDLGESARLCAASLELYRRAGNERDAARALYNLSAVAYWQGEFARSAELADEAATIFGALDDQMGLAYAREGAGMAAYRLGRHDEARGKLAASLAALCELGDRGGEALALYELGLVAHARGDAREAERLQRAGLALAWEIGDRRRVAFCLQGLAAAAPLREAARLLGAADALREELQAPVLGPDREDYERCLAALRGLGGPAGAAAWAEGRAAPTAAILAACRGGTALPQTATPALVRALAPA
jgi:predicted ATPase/transcriptional regulator with XRE-family HTH domain